LPGRGLGSITTINDLDDCFSERKSPFSLTIRDFQGKKGKNHGLTFRGKKEKTSWKILELALHAIKNPLCGSENFG